MLPEAPREEVVGPSLVGSIIEGVYEVDALIGEGAMGSVYRAHDTRRDRAVALKVLHANLRDVARTRQRFVREAEAASRIDHARVIRVLDAGTSDTGLPFIVMELASGEPLSARVEREGELPVLDALRIAVEMLEGLRAAHLVGVVHRDVKPENVFVGPDGVKLLDFSVAKMVGELTRFTAPGEVVGTPAYLAPEQASGAVVDDLTDAWAATVVLYEMLTGTLPFEGEHLGQIVTRIIHAEPIRPSAHRPDLPPALDAIVEAGLRKDRHERAPVEQLKDDLLGLAKALGHTPPS